ncbi:Mia40p NDAI_0D04680 [Naumovozyma dairenensis CBS 421]|uniref:Mitochondrial intermembrane space import and assembly protein 40 n=1 Tax=Naumovozyma dairenensis (strain ATCC 10597 / BCRC 20456 / CBS 421 / NBRC 0211 / NRRL Y-12639) TaxID=1071378 RepID=G0WAH0_NAUDC|nr:hypothetical protein NDAI_0D04680 [Naumovozyma dairenensis CBS 421]CCD24781.1 hypothetical protein NDAI_0D04680 [Naumovozyma dairenensis CBS 421]
MLPIRRRLPNAFPSVITIRRSVGIIRSRNNNKNLIWVPCRHFSSSSPSLTRSLIPLSIQSYFRKKPTGQTISAILITLLITTSAIYWISPNKNKHTLPTIDAHENLPAGNVETLKNPSLEDLRNTSENIEDHFVTDNTGTNQPIDPKESTLDGPRIEIPVLSEENIRNTEDILLSDENDDDNRHEEQSASTELSGDILSDESINSERDGENDSVVWFDSVIPPSIGSDEEPSKDNIITEDQISNADELKRLEDEINTRQVKEQSNPSPTESEHVPNLATGSISNHLDESKNPVHEEKEEQFYLEEINIPGDITILNPRSSVPQDHECEEEKQKITTTTVQRTTPSEFEEFEDTEDEESLSTNDSLNYEEIIIPGDINLISMNDHKFHHNGDNKKTVEDVKINTSQPENIIKVVPGIENSNNETNENNYARNPEVGVPTSATTEDEDRKEEASRKVVEDRLVEERETNKSAGSVTNDIENDIENKKEETDTKIELSSNSNEPGIDEIIEANTLTKQDIDETLSQDEEENMKKKEKELHEEGAYNPDTGEINWDCPCLGGMAQGPCGNEFKIAFSCFVYSKTEPKGSDCWDKFKNMQTCFRLYPEYYSNDIGKNESKSEVIKPKADTNTQLPPS